MSFASDMWALGCVMFEMLSGKPPFMSQNFKEVLNSILHSTPPPLPHASEACNDLISQLLRKDPSHRPTWQQLIDHPFWRTRLQPVEMPRQPRFDATLTRGGSADAKIPSRPREVDVLRLSRCVASGFELILKGL